MSEEFDMIKWQKDLHEEEAIFNIEPKTAHKIWDLLEEQMGEVFTEHFPTSSNFFHFLNKNIISESFIDSHPDIYKEISHFHDDGNYKAAYEILSSYITDEDTLNNIMNELFPNEKD
jgi:hypothetical protein